MIPVKPGTHDKGHSNNGVRASILVMKEVVPMIAMIAAIAL